MHTFQPYPIDKMEFNPFTKIGKEWALVCRRRQNQMQHYDRQLGRRGRPLGKKRCIYFYP